MLDALDPDAGPNASRALFPATALDPLQGNGLPQVGAVDFVESGLEAMMTADADGVIALSTARNMEVPVEVFVTDDPPPFDEDAGDHAVTCSISIQSGRLVVPGCTDDITTAARIPLPPGTYRARALFAGLESLSEDGLDGEDRYWVALWPGTPLPLDVLKRHTSTSP